MTFTLLAAARSTCPISGVLALNQLLIVSPWWRWRWFFSNSASRPTASAIIETAWTARKGISMLASSLIVSQSGTLQQEWRVFVGNRSRTHPTTHNKCWFSGWDHTRDLLENLSYPLQMQTREEKDTQCIEAPTQGGRENHAQMTQGHNFGDALDYVFSPLLPFIRSLGKDSPIHPWKPTMIHLDRAIPCSKIMACFTGKND
jgi:hypothetical protein